MNNEGADHVYCFIQNTTIEEKVDKMVREQFIIENYGVNGNAEIEYDENKICEEKAKTSIKQIGNQYEIGLPWKNDEEKLPNSYPLALKRLQFLEKKLLNIQSYVNIINIKFKIFSTKVTLEKFLLKT